MTAIEVKEKIPERFADKIKFGEPDECWEWQNASNKYGYGLFKVKVDVKWVTEFAHRFIYSALYGDIEGLCILHKCDNPRCVNPNHLFAGTQLDNINDRHNKGRSRGGGVRGDSHWNSKLRNDDVLKIKKRLSHGEKFDHIAKHYGVHRSTIYAIKRNFNWSTIN